MGRFGDPVAKRLSDPRWRVRAAALETIGKRNLRELSGQVTKLLQDADLFVRVTAVATLQKISQAGATPVLIEQFEKQDDLKAPILRALFAGNKAPPASVWDTLWKAPPEIILQCLDTLEDRDDSQGKRIPHAARFASHPNKDVAASALRLLASRGRHTTHLLQALKGNDEAQRDAVLDQLRLPPGFLGNTVPTSAPVETASAASTSNSVLDRLYAAFSSGARKGSAPASAETPATSREAHASPAEMKELLERFLESGSPRQRFQAANVLTSQGHTESAKFLLSSLDTLSSLDRRGSRTQPGKPCRVAGWTDPGSGNTVIERLRG